MWKTLIEQQWFQINQEYLPLAEMTKCCDAHDICYDTCNSDKEKCDLEFKRCLYKYCEGYQSSTVINTCKAAAKVLFTGTTALGCKSYMDAQKEACYCGDKWNKNKKPKKAAQAGGELWKSKRVPFFHPRLPRWYRNTRSFNPIWNFHCFIFQFEIRQYKM